MSQAPHHLLNLKQIRNLFDFKVAVITSWVSTCLDRVIITFKKYLISLLSGEITGSSIPGTRNRCEL